MKAALLVLLLLTGCATVQDKRCEAEGGCLTLSKAALIKAMQSAWNDGYGKGYETGEDNAPPSCKRSI
jgi:uncharacterized protein YceK